MDPGDLGSKTSGFSPAEAQATLISYNAAMSTCELLAPNFKDWV